jgi:hypothetical protein
MPFFRFNTYPNTFKLNQKLFLYYDSLTVQRQYERLIYNVPGFLSVLGGSIGLYLGLSVLSILFLLMDAFPKMQDVFDKKSIVKTEMTLNTVLAVQ